MTSYKLHTSQQSLVPIEVEIIIIVTDAERNFVEVCRFYSTFGKEKKVHYISAWFGKEKDIHLLHYCTQWAESSMLYLPQSDLIKHTYIQG